MRGKDLLVVQPCTADGITPAYAGKSIQPSSYGLKGWDHPRLCGEKRKLSRLLIFSLGSPPPMRGKVFASPLPVLDLRITPAYAGKRHAGSWRKVGKKDHPRLCGEKGKFVKNMMLNEGSPPPMRGKVSASTIFSCASRITPAYAGKRFHYIPEYLSE